MSRRARSVAVAALVTLVVSGCGSSSAKQASTAPSSSPFRGSVVDPPLTPADFSLRDQSGKLVRLSAQRGRIVVVAFLYTHCPDVCPLIASHLNEALRRLGPARSRVRVLAVSVDPKGDTPASVRRYVRERGLLPQFRYLTGTRRELAPVWRAYHVAVRSGKLDTVDHIAYELLIDARGRGRLIYDSQVRAADVAHDVRLLLTG